MDEEKKKKIVIACFIVGGVLAIGGFLFGICYSRQADQANSCVSEECLEYAKILKQSMNPDVHPCDDFYEFACGGVRINNLPSTMETRRLKILEEILEFLKQHNTADEPQAVHKVRDLYSLCMDEEAYGDHEQVYDILLYIGIPIMAMATGENKKFDYVTGLATITKLAGLNMFFDLKVEYDPYNRSVNCLTIMKPAIQIDPNIMPIFDRSMEKRQLGEFQNIMIVLKTKICRDFDTQNMCKHWNDNLMRSIFENYDKRAQILMKARHKMNVSMALTAYTLQELQTMTNDIAAEVNSQIPMLNWTKYIETMLEDLNGVTLDLRNSSNVKIILAEQDFLKDMIRFIVGMDVKSIELAIWWDVIYTLLPYADYDIFKNKANLLSMARNSRCAVIATILFGPAVSYLHVVAEGYGVYYEKKKGVADIFENIRQVFKENLNEISWMDEETRKNALKKLASMQAHTSYPSIIDSPNELDKLYEDVIIIMNDFLGTITQKIQTEIMKKWSRLNKMNNINDTDWTLPSNMVNAFHVPNYNSVFLPIGMLGYPVYPRGLKSLDYGTLGYIMAHEMAHGFEYVGKDFDEIGNIRSWWDESTLKTFKERADCVIKAYGGYSSNISGIYQKVDSQITVNEDICDISAFKLALLAYRKFVSKNGPERRPKELKQFNNEQLLTLSLANVWCERPREMSTLQIASFDHSPNPIRVNGALKNSPEFAKIWRCPKGAEMNPVDKCSVW